MMLARLCRLRGQIRGCARIGGAGKSCLNILTRRSAVIALARAAGLLVREDHIRGCVVDGGPADGDAVLDELTRTIS